MRGVYVAGMAAVLALTAPAVASAGPTAPVDPQNWTFQDNLTWNDYKPLPVSATAEWERDLFGETRLTTIQAEGVTRPRQGVRLDLHRVAPGRQEPCDSRAEPHQLAARIRAREVPRQVDDQQARERLHRSEAIVEAG